MGVTLPMGDQNVPQNLLESPTPPDEVKEAIKSALKAASGKDGQWSLTDVIKACEQAKTRDDHMMQVRLFIAAVFEFGIFTSASKYLSAENLKHVYDIQQLVRTDWCKKLIDHMQRCLKTFDDTKRVFSPLTFTLFFLESIDCPLPNDMETPRMKYYTEGQFRDIVAAFKKGVKLKDWKDTVFGRENIAEVQASEIKYAENYKEAVKKRKGKDPSRVLKEKGVWKKPKIDKKPTDDSNKHDQFFRADIDGDILHFYKENVAEKTRDEIVLNILDHQVSEMNYVECFKEEGHMNTSIMFMQCALWNEEWKEKAIDKVILSYEAMLQLSGQKKGQSTLAAELLTGDLELQANLIFVPIIHDLHWFLIVISREKTIYILDSFKSESRDPLICRILTTLKQLLGSGYISEVLEVLPQKNNYDCGFHVLLYINGFDDKKPEQICGVNKDMVEKCRIETSVHLRRHKLNKPAEVIIVDDDDVEVLENRFSYDNCRFNAALRGEGENHELSTPSFMDRTETFMSGFDMDYIPDDETDKLQINVDGKKTRNARAEGSSIQDDGDMDDIPDDETNNLEINVDGKETGKNGKKDDGTNKDGKKEINVDGKKTGNARTGKNGKKDDGTNKDGKKETKNARAESNVDGRKKTDNTMPQDSNHYERRQKKPSQEQQPEDSSAVMKSRSERQLKPPPDFSELHDKRTRQYINFEVLENAYKLAIEQEKPILKFKDISMTGPQLEKCLQGGQDARDLIIILMELLGLKIKIFKRIFVSPLDKDDERLEEKIQGALPLLNRDKIRASTAKLLENTIIYFPVFFSGEWIVVCFVFSPSKNQIHVYCHNNSFEEVRKFSLTMGAILSTALKEHSMEVTFSQAKVACTRSTIKASDSAAASMYFLENFFTAREGSQFIRFETECDELRDEFVKRVKFGLVQYLLCHKKNLGEVPDTVLELLKNRMKDT